MRHVLLVFLLGASLSGCGWGDAESAKDTAAGVGSVRAAGESAPEGARVAASELEQAYNAGEGAAVLALLCPSLRESIVAGQGAESFAAGVASQRRSSATELEVGDARGDGSWNVSVRQAPAGEAQAGVPVAEDGRMVLVDGSWCFLPPNGGAVAEVESEEHDHDH